MDTDDELASPRSASASTAFVNNVLSVKDIQTTLLNRFFKNLPALSNIIRQSSSRSNYDSIIEQRHYEKVYLDRSDQFDVANLLGVFAMRDIEYG